MQLANNYGTIENNASARGTVLSIFRSKKYYPQIVTKLQKLYISDANGLEKPSQFPSISERYIISLFPV